MYLGILIGLAIAGLAIIIGNYDDPYNDARSQRAYARCVGWTMTSIGLCGSIGWLVELFA